MSRFLAVCSLDVWNYTNPSLINGQTLKTQEDFSIHPLFCLQLDLKHSEFLHNSNLGSFRLAQWAQSHLDKDLNREIRSLSMCLCDKLKINQDPQETKGISATLCTWMGWQSAAYSQWIRAEVKQEKLRNTVRHFGRWVFTSPCEDVSKRIHPLTEVFSFCFSCHTLMLYFCNILKIRKR